MLIESATDNYELAPKAREILDYIRAYWLENHVSPSYREIASGVGLRSVASVNWYIKSLTNKGEILPHKGKMRCLVLKDQC